MQDSKFKIAKLEWEVDRLTQEFHALAEANQGLDWEIPSQYDKLLLNVDRMEWIERRLRQIDPMAHAEAHATHAVRQHFASLPPVSSKKKHTVIDATTPRHRAAVATLDTLRESRAKMIRKKHLTLVWSKE